MEPPAEPETEPGAAPFELPVTDILDLHAFSPKDIPAVVETYLDEARRKGFATVRIIHGRGIGVQRERVQSVLSRTASVAWFQDAPGAAGGWGATIVWFKNAGFKSVRLKEEPSGEAGA